MVVIQTIVKQPILAEDVVPIAEFKTHASAVIRRMRATGHPIVITQNGRPAAVVLAPEDFDELRYGQHVRAKVKAGSDSLGRGTLTSDAVRARVKAKLLGASKR